MNNSLQAIISQATKQLPHSTTSHLDVEMLLCQILNVTRSYLLAYSEQLLTAEQINRLQYFLARRARGEPIAYLLGHKEFWSLPLTVTPNTLIPRPETELLVEQALARLPQDSQELVVDLGTGCGAIALAIAQERPQCRVIATDISPATLQVAQSNAQQLGFHQVKFILSDWWAALDDVMAKLVVANPPYVAVELIQGELCYEPRQALVAENNGLMAIAQIISQSFAHIMAGGWLLIEHGCEQANAVQKLFKKQGYTAVEGYFDLAGRARVTVGKVPLLEVPSMPSN